jgi:hypothetical protein
MGARSVTPGSSARRAAELLLTLSAAGEVGVGLLAALLPAPVMRFLLGAPLEATGVVVARMMGIAVAAMGLAWWPDRNRLDPERLREVAPSFIGYNLGVGLLFVAVAWTIGRELSVPALVASVHLLAASGLAIIVSRKRATDDHASIAVAVDSPDPTRPKESGR